jgi:cell wall-associated NlpC family hydrolase
MIEQRDAVIAEAKSWLNTPYHHMGRVKGLYGGVDCATLLLEVYERAGLIPRIEIDHYPPDWYMHRSEERYLDWLLKFAVKVDFGAKPGDVEVFQFGRCVSHAAIILDWPMAIHAWKPAGCVLEDNVRVNVDLKHRSKGIYRYQGWGD